MTFKRELGEKLEKASAEVEKWSAWEREITKQELGESFSKVDSNRSVKVEAICQA